MQIILHTTNLSSAAINLYNIKCWLNHLLYTWKPLFSMLLGTKTENLHTV